MSHKPKMPLVNNQIAHISERAAIFAGFPRFVPLDFLNTVPLLNA
jgi:hypothetical protein